MKQPVTRVHFLFLILILILLIQFIFLTHLSDFLVPGRTPFCCSPPKIVVQSVYVPRIWQPFRGRRRQSVKMGLRQTRLPLWLKAVLFGAAYFACAKGSMFLNATGSPNASFWLPCGFYVAVLLLNNYNSWPALVLAASVANVLFDSLQATPPS